MADIHKKMIFTKSKRVNFTGQTDFKDDVFVTNKLGYLSICEAVTYPLNLMSGRVWCLFFFPKYELRSMIIVSQSGKFYGGN
jgi:hypothetical protein